VKNEREENNVGPHHVPEHYARPHRFRKYDLPDSDVDWTSFQVSPSSCINNSTYEIQACRPAEQDNHHHTKEHAQDQLPAPSTASSYTMALSNVGSLILNLLIFITTLVNFTFTLTSLEPLVLLTLYAISKIFVTAPDAGIFAKCQHRHLYQDG